MPSLNSKKKQKKKLVDKKLTKEEEKKCGPFKAAFLENYKKAREKVWKQKRARVRLHQSFKRS